MKKIIIAIIMALMSISAFGQVVDTGKFYELHVGDYVDKSLDSGYKFEKEHGWIDFGFDFADREEAKVFYNFLTNNKRRLENKWEIKFGDVYLIDRKEFGVNAVDMVKYGRYLVSVRVIFPDVYEQHKEKEAREKQEEMNKRISSLRGI